MKNRLLIIVLNYENYQLTSKCVDQLLEIGVMENILIVDNMSNNDSYTVLQEKYISINNVSVIQSERNGGYSYGNNYGIKYFLINNTVEYVCIMNPDVIIEQNYFSELCTILDKSPLYAGISTKMFLDGKYEVDRISWELINNVSLYKDFNLLRFNSAQTRTVYNIEYQNLINVDVLPGSFFIIKEKVFREIGYFDENIFLYHEENVIGLKLKELGYQLLLDTGKYYLHNHHKNPSSQVWFDYKYNLKKIMKNYEHEYNSRLYICKRYFSGQNLWKLKTTWCFNNILLFMKHLISFIKCRSTDREER